MPVEIVALLGTLVSGVPAVAAARADTTPPPARTQDELRHQLDSIRRKYRVPGVGLALVTRDSTLWAGGLGSADLARDRPVTAETHFRVGSISKSFVALGILRLVADGRLRLDAPVRSIAPELEIANPWEATRPITVANLLEHTAGFDDMHFNEMYVRSKQPYVRENGSRSCQDRMRAISRCAARQYTDPDCTAGSRDASCASLITAASPRSMPRDR